MTAARVLIHATSVALCDAAKPFGGAPDAGVLLLGESGAGKSDVALRMIALGAKLISDDQTALFVREGDLYAEAPQSLAGLMEIRGVGIVPVPTSPPVPMVLAVQLDVSREIERMPQHASYRLPATLQSLPSLPLIVLHPFDASTPAKIVAAAVAAASGKLA